MTRNESRRSFLRRTAALAVAGGAPALALRPALAEGAYPSRPIKVLIGTPPGDSLDGYMRLLAEGMGRHLGQAIVVDNKPGAHGMIVGGAAKAATPDGYTVLASSGGPMSINPGLYKERLNYDPLKDFAPIAPVLRGPIFLYCNNDVPVHNLKEMVAWVKQQGNKVSYGSGGTGTTQHLTMELLKRATGMQMTHVPYRGSPMVLSDVMGGQIPFAFDAGGSLLPQARAGKVRLLGVAAAKRYPGMPDVPTLAEQGAPGVEAVVWMGMFAPAGTPAPVIARLNEAVLKSASTPEFAKKLEHAASDVWTGSPDDLRKFLMADIQKWTAVIQSAGIKIE